MSSETGKKKISLESLSKQELISYIHQSEAHVKQLQNVIAKQCKKKEAIGNKNKSFNFKKYKMRHVALKLLYLGWNYQGFAAQEDMVKTIEAELFSALKRTKLIESRETSNYHRCGRTDKGVSAFCQVISIDLRTNQLEGKGVITPKDFSAEKVNGEVEEIDYAHILNSVLPPEIRIIAWTPVETDFSARFNCIQRTYKYYFPKGNLNIERMQEAGQHFIGQHDFRNICKMDVGNGVINYIRKIHSINIASLTSSSESSYQLYELTVVGQAFLWHQVRCIVAILFLVGQEKENPQIVKHLLNVEKCPQKPQYTMASEIPLVLFDCQYNDLEWHYEHKIIIQTIKHLQDLWTQQAVRCTMIRSMLRTLEASNCINETVCFQNDSLSTGLKSRIYKPLLERPVCESLEERIQHFSKKQKLNLQEKNLPDSFLNT